VAYIEDLSGNENHRIQATVAKRPTLQQDPNGAYKLVYDGVDDYIDVTYSSAISTPISTVNVVRKAPNRRILNETTDTRRLVLLIEIAGDETLLFYAKDGGGLNPGAEDISIPSGVEILILGTVWAQENSLYRINGVQNTGVFDPGSNTETSGYRTAANNTSPPINHSVLEEYGAIQIDRELTTEQFEQIEDYFRLEVGIATIVPTITASDSLSGRTLTITVDSTTGTPAPTTALTALTLGGVNVLGDVTGIGPWSYEVPDSADGQTVAWTVEASNVEGSDTASGSEAVPAKLFTPASLFASGQEGLLFKPER